MCNTATKRITKVKYDGKRVLIRHETLRGGDDWDFHEMSSCDEPRAGFKEALNNLRDHVAKVCECTKTWASDLEVRGVSLSYKNDVMTTVITASKPLSTAAAPMTINTPALPDGSFSENGEDGNPTMPKKMLDCIHAVIGEAEAYLKGERAQMQMFTDGDDS